MEMSKRPSRVEIAAQDPPGAIRIRNRSRGWETSTTRITESLNLKQKCGNHRERGSGAGLPGSRFSERDSRIAATDDQLQPKKTELR